MFAELKERARLPLRSICVIGVAALALILVSFQSVEGSPARFARSAPAVDPDIPSDDPHHHHEADKTATPDAEIAPGMGASRAEQLMDFASLLEAATKDHPDHAEAGSTQAPAVAAPTEAAATTPAGESRADSVADDITEGSRTHEKVVEKEHTETTEKQGDSRSAAAASASGDDVDTDADSRSDVADVAGKAANEVKKAAAVATTKHPADDDYDDGESAETSTTKKPAADEGSRADLEDANDEEADEKKEGKSRSAVEEDEGDDGGVAAASAGASGSRAAAIDKSNGEFSNSNTNDEDYYDKDSSDTLTENEEND